MYAWFYTPAISACVSIFQQMCNLIIRFVEHSISFGAGICIGLFFSPTSSITSCQLWAALFQFVHALLCHIINYRFYFVRYVLVVFRKPGCNLCCKVFYIYFFTQRLPTRFSAYNSVFSSFFRLYVRYTVSLCPLYSISV